MDAVAGPMLRPMKQLGINAKFIGGDGICTTELPNLAQGAMRDSQVICAEAGGVEGARTEAMERFLQLYPERFGEEAKGPAPYAFDAVNLLADAMVRAGSADPARHLPSLGRTDGSSGVTGTISFDGKGDLRNGAMTLYTFRGNRRDAVAVIR